MTEPRDILERLEGYNPAAVTNDGPAAYARDQETVRQWLAERDAKLLAEALLPFEELADVFAAHVDHLGYTGDEKATFLTCANKLRAALSQARKAGGDGGAGG